MLGFFTLIAAAFAVYSMMVTENYRQLRTNEVLKTVAFESERVGTVIAEMERNVVDLALSGQQFYLSEERPGELGASISVENFSAFPTAVGGGIWYEPYALNPAKERVCYYAFFDPSINAVRHDPDFETQEYDYLSQMWYQTIAEGLSWKYDTVWTPPYYDDTGTNALMTTVGAGIYDNVGRFVGMSTVDWDIRSMVKRLTTIKPTANSFVLLASPKDDYVISNTQPNTAGQTGASLQAIAWYSALHPGSNSTVGTGRFTDGGLEYISFSRILANGWLFSVQIPAGEIFAGIETRNNQFTVIIAAAFVGLLLLAGILLSWLINRPLRKLTLGVAELGSGDLDKTIEIKSKDEFGTLAAAFNKMTVDLKASIEESARERVEKERIGAELNVATQIQASMLPCIFPPFPERDEFDIYAGMQPAKEVGGDFYDFFLLDENTLAVVIADVSGKGVPAALFMVIAKTLIQNTALSGKRPEVVFGIVNKMLCENNEAGMFVTAFLGYLDLTTGSFTYVNAGHNPPLLKRKGENFDWLKSKVGFVLAGDEDTFYLQQEIQLAPGDELFLYTDGVTEAVNNKEELFGEARLLDTVNRSPALPVKVLTQAVKREIESFAEDAQQADDITMLALRYQHHSSTGE